MIKKEQMIKQDSMSKGDLRKMKCTKALSYIPDDKHPIGKNIMNLNEDVIRVYDVEADGWRSFRADSIKTFKVV